MDRKQATLLIGAVLFFVVSLTVAALVGQQRAQSGAAGTAKRFVAKSGTTRENARFLRSKRAPTENRPSGNGSGKQDRPGEWGEPDYDIASVTTEDPAELDATPEEAAVRSVMDQLESGAGLELVLAALRAADPNIDECVALTRLGEAYGQFEPPKTEQAQQAFDQALAAATDPEQRAMILAAAAEQYLDAGAIDAARIRIESGLVGLETVTPAQLRLSVLLARSHEDREEMEQAKQLYAAAVDGALLLPPDTATAPAVTDMLRLASARLAWIYHQEGRHEDAEALAKRVRPVLETATE